VSCRRRGYAVEVDPGLRQGRVGTPESVLTTEVGQAGIDAHACAGGNDQRIGLPDEVGGALH